MSTKRYDIVGMPSGLLAKYVAGHSIGDRIEADLTKDEEAALIGAGAFRVVPGPRPGTKAEPKAEPKPVEPPKPAAKPEQPKAPSKSELDQNPVKKPEKSDAVGKPDPANRR